MRTPATPQPAASTGSDAVDAYIAAFPLEVQATLSRIRELIRAAEPAVTEAIKYGMPAMVLEGRHAVYVAGWAKHVAVYPVHTAPEPLESELTPYRSGTDTVKFVHTKPVPWGLVERLVGFLTADLRHSDVGGR